MTPQQRTAALRLADDDFATSGEAAALLRELAQEPQAEPSVWLVIDKAGNIMHAAGWREAAHEHINDAINEHDLTEAAEWKVVPAYAHPPQRNLSGRGDAPAVAASPEESALTADVFEALDLRPEQFLTDSGLVNRGKLRAALWYPHDYLPEGHWMRAADEGRLRAEIERLRAALAELVACNDLKTWLDRNADADGKAGWEGVQLVEKRTDYAIRKPLAWKAAREALKP